MDMDKFNRIMGEMEATIGEAIKADKQKKIYVSYSAYSVDSYDNPINNLNQIAVKGRVQLIKDANFFYGGPKSKDYASPILDNPTWLQVAVCANAMIKRTRDRHHCFLEGLRLSCRVDGVGQYELVMGS